MATIKAAIMVFECPGSRPCSTPSKMALGKYSQACEAPCCNSSAKLDMERDLEVLGDLLEIFE